MDFEIVPPGTVKEVVGPEYLGGIPIWCDSEVIIPGQVAAWNLDESREEVAVATEDAVIAAARGLGESALITVTNAVVEARRAREERRKRGWIFSDGFPPDYVHPEPDEVHRTDEADALRGRRTIDAGGRSGRPVAPAGKVFTSISVLEFLSGKPWNALALNYVEALRPSKIRVIGHGEAVECDSVPWRVTVHLSPDGRNIRWIDQEVACGGRGVYNGHDLRRRLMGLPFERDDGKAKVIINARGVQRGVRDSA